jgi:hypothetical protein
MGITEIAQDRILQTQTKRRLNHTMTLVSFFFSCIIHIVPVDEEKKFLLPRLNRKTNTKKLPTRAMQFS